ncbi:MULTISPECIES: DUF732 domain-containing protein [unclassified Mycolicibacterium]|nr:MULTISPECIES: DUF732 domain-containing protein [unclassified Mycolicibacterium]
MNNLAVQGITGDPSKLISTAHMVCSTRNEESSVPGGLGRMLPMGYAVANLRLNVMKAGQFVEVARSAYCPDPAGVQPDSAVPPPPATPALAGVPRMNGLASVLGGQS